VTAAQDAEARISALREERVKLQESVARLEAEVEDLKARCKRLHTPPAVVLAFDRERKEQAI
jgi:predicted nuclease with TOPRIM domain